MRNSFLKLKIHSHQTRKQPVRLQLQKKEDSSNEPIESYRTIKRWNFNDPKAIKVNKKIMNMIAMDNQPFTITSDQGFIDLLATLKPCYSIPYVILH